MLLTTLLAVTAVSMWPRIGIVLGAAIVVIGVGIGIGNIGGKAMDAIARQPEAANNIRMSMILAAALIEGVAFFALIVCLLGYFV
ncbi:MAG: ATP synthase F0 subunit C [Bacteroidales bacterium]